MLHKTICIANSSSLNVSTCSFLMPTVIARVSRIPAWTALKTNKRNRQQKESWLVLRSNDTHPLLRQTVHQIRGRFLYELDLKKRGNSFVMCNIFFQTTCKRVPDQSENYSEFHFGSKIPSVENDPIVSQKKITAKLRRRMWNRSGPLFIQTPLNYPI